MPKAFPEEFRRDVVAVARKREYPIAQVARDFGISEGCLHNWLRRADIEDGLVQGVSPVESEQLREIRKRNRVLEQENEILRRAATFFAREAPPKMMYPLVSDCAADGIEVGLTCRVLGFSKQAYYKWRARPVSDRDWADAHLIDAALHVHDGDPEFGYRLIADELAERGIRAGDSRVQRLCRVARIRSSIHPRRGAGPILGPAVHDDLVERDFRASALNRLWFADITEHPTDEGKLYLCAIKDACSNRIVGYSMDSGTSSSLALAALRNATSLREPRRCVLHTDHAQFRSRAFTNALTTAGMNGSMGRVAADADHAAMESFFSLLQKNVLNRKRWKTHEELRLAIIVWIERTYHRRRRQQGLGGLTPIEFEILRTTPQAT
ncbi:MAG: IS3 family transposase [Candidatus Nanopelagicales bacterium]|nr:IS3 family transposase [Candidatus Nanopelagicales bacterium]